MARRSASDLGSRSRSSSRHTRSPRVPSANSGLLVLAGCAPASKRRKSLLRSRSAGREPVALVTTRGGRCRPGRVRRRTAEARRRSPRPCARSRGGAGARPRRGRRARWAAALPTRGRSRRRHERKGCPMRALRGAGAPSSPRRLARERRTPPARVRGGRRRHVTSAAAAGAAAALADVTRPRRTHLRAAGEAHRRVRGLTD